VHFDIRAEARTYLKGRLTTKAKCRGFFAALRMTSWERATEKTKANTEILSEAQNDDVYRRSDLRNDDA
jgi:hypothetical protein